MVVLAVDPGLRATCGWAVLRIPREALRAPGGAFLRHVRLLEFGVLDLERMTPYLAARALVRVAKKHRATEVLIEDFFFWREERPRKGSVLVVSRMKEFIGYLRGFFHARGIFAETVHPTRWKSALARTLPEDSHGPERVLSAIEESLLRIFPEVARLPASRRRHVVSALGLALVRIAEVAAPENLPEPEVEELPGDDPAL